jgi:hypothetical protein
MSDDTRAGFSPTRLVRYPFWLVRCLYTSRLFYEDGTSERFKRSWVWGVMRPHPWLFGKYRLMKLTPWAVRQEGCGCSYWFGRRVALCTTHLWEELDV